MILTRDLTNQIPKDQNILTSIGGFGLDGLETIGLPESGDIVINVEGVPHIKTKFGELFKCFLLWLNSFKISSFIFKAKSNLIPYLSDSRSFSSVWYQPNDRWGKGSISSCSQVSLNLSNFYYILAYLFFPLCFHVFFLSLLQTICQYFGEGLRQPKWNQCLVSRI